jgi:hypothetical protein
MRIKELLILGVILTISGCCESRKFSQSNVIAEGCIASITTYQNGFGSVEKYTIKFDNGQLLILDGDIGEEIIVCLWPGSCGTFYKTTYSEVTLFEWKENNE